MNKRSVIRYAGLALPTLALSFNGQANEKPIDNAIEEVEVVGHETSLALPVKQLDQSALEQASAGNMSKLLQRLPGINNASYGEAVGRPVIRGLSANRVKLSVNGASNADVSNMSADHAPMMEIVNAKEVEVIYGPNTLRFGSGAMGGMVNVNDGRFHDEIFSGVKSRVQGSLGSNANSQQTAATIDFAKANGDETRAHIGHIDLQYRQSDNYTAGDNNGESKQIDSSSTEALGGSIAYNLLDSETGHIGAAIAYLDYAYGLPNAEGIDAKVTPEQWRLDVQASLLALSPSLDKWETKFSFIDYQHEELMDAKAEALFEKQVTELQSTLFFHTASQWLLTTGLQLKHEDFALCHNHSGCSEIPDYSALNWDGMKGINLINDSFDGYHFNHSTPMPLTQTLDAGVYFIASKTLDKLTAEMGMRYESSTLSLDSSSILPSYRRAKSDYDDVQFQPLSISAGLSWDLGLQRIAVNLSHSERAPAGDEMFYNGDHHATFSYQLDNPELDIESANSLDLTWQFSLQSAQVNAAVFYYDFNDYIYNDLKSVKDPYHGRDVYRYEQADAQFVGGEISLDVPIASDWLFFSSVDIVQAQLKHGDNKNLPRIPPATLLTGLKWQTDAWDIEGNMHYFHAQDNIADNETITDDYVTLNAYAAYTLEVKQTALTLQLKANNLLNEYGINHASYLKDISPVQGRNIELSFILQL